MRRIYSVASDIGAVSILEEPTGWVIFEGDDFNVPRIDAVFSAAPVSAGLITVTKKRFDDPTFAAIIYTVNPIGQTVVSIETLHGFVNGDHLVIEYSNPDSLGIQATASTELPLIGDLSTSGVTADNGTIRSLDSDYVRYSKIPLGSISPGASGALWEPCDANALAGWRVDAITETLYTDVVILDDWDTSTVPVLQATYTVMVGGVAADDLFEIKFDIGYKSHRNQTMRSQTVIANRVVGPIPQYTTVSGNVDIPIDITDNEILPGDTLCVSMQLTSNSDIGDVRINAASFYYKTTHVGTESGDV